uniref:Uncharacterized protein n=1 Tax=Lepisosteus oculatus TaxID=7918 RepID=W5N963_LEPOC
ILFWLVNKIHPKDVVRIISAEIPDKVLFDVVVQNMIHRPCGPRNSPYMQDIKCIKRYPREFLQETQTDQDCYPLHKRRKPEDCGHEAIIMINDQEVFVDNRWVVPAINPLLSKTFKAHIKVEYCSSVKSIKYMFKYINNGIETAVFGIQNKESNNKITKFEMGRYISSNEAWKILKFPISKHNPTVFLLAVHLENGQCVYFNPET